MMELFHDGSVLVKIGPCVLAAVLIHPTTSHHIVNRLLWAFCVYLEAVSVLPQLRVMQNTRVHSTMPPLILLSYQEDIHAQFNFI